MPSISRRTFCIALALAALPARSAPSAWPDRVVKILVPGGAGGVTDVRARWFAERLAAVVGQPVVVENRPGAGGLIGMEAAARTEPDGYTLVIVHQGTMVLNPHVYAKLPYDPAQFTPITRLGMGPLVMAVSNDLGVTSVRELIALSKSRAKPLTYGSPGVGTPPHIAAALFTRLSGVPAIHVPYRGGGAAASDLLGGHIDFEVEGLSVLLPYIKAGRMRALATTGEARVQSLPDTPTMMEAGVPEYVYNGWVGLAVPAATPPALVAKIYAACAKVLDTPEAVEWFAAVGAVPGAVPPESFAASIREEQSRLGRLIREAGIKAE